MGAIVESPGVVSGMVKVDCVSVADGLAALDAVGARRRKRVLVTGSRFWTSAQVVAEALSGVLKPGQVLIEGEARGADRIAADVGVELEAFVLGFPAPWARYGRSAGPRRNELMLAMRPAVVVAFSDDVKASKGTRHCMSVAWELGLPIRLFDSSGASQSFQRAEPVRGFDSLPVEL